MAAIIRSFRNGITPLDGVSRDDLVMGDVVLLTAVDAHSTYNWVIAFAPETSAATFSGTATSASPGTFTVDVEGPYLIKLTVDAGDPTEDTQYVRLRAKTAFGSLCLVAAGERRDEDGIIPVDVDTEGWANEQNYNLVTLKDFVKPLVSSGRLLYVDANDGTSNYADHDTIQGAITAATTAGATDSEQWVVAVRPGVYIEDVTFAPYVHVVGWPGNPDGRSSEAVVLRTATVSGHEAAIASGFALISGLHIEGTLVTSNPVLRKTGAGGQLLLHRTRIEQLGVDASQGPALDLQSGSLRVEASTIFIDTTNAADRVAYAQTGAATSSRFDETEITGPSAVDLNAGLAVSQTAIFDSSRLVGTDVAGWGLRTSTQDLEISRSVITVPAGASSSAVLIHPSGGALVGNIDATFRFTSVAGDINFDTTGVAGTSTLNTSGVEYDNLTFPAVDPDLNALVQSKTHFYDNTISGLIAENVQDAIDEIAGVASIAPVVYHKNMPAVANDVVRYRGWAPISSELLFVRVYMQSVNTQGNYTLEITNEATGNTVLSAPFDMNTLAAATVTAVPLTATSSDLQFAAQDAWTIELTSDDPGFDGDSIYVSLVFNTAAGGGPVVEDWATVLAVGNISGGTNPTISANDVMVFESSPAAPVSAASTGRIRYNQGTTSFQASVDGGPWADFGGGGGSPFIHKNTPPLPNNTYRYEGWSPIDAVVTDISVYMQSVNTQGNYTVVFTNETTGMSMLVGASFDMNTLAAGTVTPLTLTGTLADLTFSAGDEFSVEFTSDDLAFDGDGIYWSILFGTSSTLAITAAPDDNEQFEMTVFPANTVNTYWFAPYNCEVVALKVYADTTPTTAGVYTLAIEDVDNANNLLAAATFDMTSLGAATLTTLTLTGTAADLLLALGTRVRFQLVSDNGDLVATGVYVQIVYRSQ